MTAVAFFVTPHGFGHAARACAVIGALARHRPGLRFHIFTTVPRWFFSESLPDCFEYHPCASDVGLVQVSPLEEDLEATLEALDRAPWRDPETVATLTRRLVDLGCSLVIADISPLGLRLARRTGLPSVLVENFTWDWIYRELEAPAALRRHGEDLAADFAAVDLLIQTRPVCSPVGHAVRVNVVARQPRLPRAEVRRRLGVPAEATMVLASMGGVPWNYGSLDHVTDGGGPWVVVPGAADPERRRGRLVLLPFHSAHYHPDLVHAADAVVGKLGYSTVAETCQAGAALAYVERPRFPESPVLAGYVNRHLTSRAITSEDFENGAWMPVVRELLAGARRPPPPDDGAAEAAAAILQRFPEVFG
jgi:hypothetical protein